MFVDVIKISNHNFKLILFFSILTFLNEIFQYKEPKVIKNHLQRSFCKQSNHPYIILIFFFLPCHYISLETLFIIFFFMKNDKGSINMHIWEGKNLCYYCWDSITHLQYSQISWSHMDNARGVRDESNHSFCNRVENGSNICQVCIKLIYIFTSLLFCIIGFKIYNTKLFHIIFNSVYTTWMYTVVMNIFPFSCLAIFNLQIYFQIRKANQERAKLSRLQQREIGLATMLMCVVIVFFACNILAVVNNVLEVIACSYH